LIFKEYIYIILFFFKTKTAREENYKRILMQNDNKKVSLSTSLPIQKKRWSGTPQPSMGERSSTFQHESRALSYRSQMNRAIPSGVCLRNEKRKGRNCLRVGVKKKKNGKKKKTGQAHDKILQKGHPGQKTLSRSATNPGRAGHDLSNEIYGAKRGRLKDRVLGSEKASKEKPEMEEQSENESDSSHMYTRPTGLVYNGMESEDTEEYSDMETNERKSTKSYHGSHDRYVKRALSRDGRSQRPFNSSHVGISSSITPAPPPSLSHLLMKRHSTYTSLTKLHRNNLGSSDDNDNNDDGTRANRKLLPLSLIETNNSRLYHQQGQGNRPINDHFNEQYQHTPTILEHEEDITKKTSSKHQRQKSKSLAGARLLFHDHQEDSRSVSSSQWDWYNLQTNVYMFVFVVNTYKKIIIIKIKIKIKNNKTEAKRRPSGLVALRDMLQAQTETEENSDGANEEMADTVIFDMVDRSKWSLDTLMEIGTLEELTKYVREYSREDLIQLCWDLLRSNEKCGELLHMVTGMNQNLQDEERAFDHMMTTTKISLSCSFASLYAVEEDRRSLRCLCTSDVSNRNGQHHAATTTTTTTTKTDRVMEGTSDNEGRKGKEFDNRDRRKMTTGWNGSRNDERNEDRRSGIAAEQEIVVNVSHLTEQESIPAKVFRTARSVNCVLHDNGEMAMCCPEYNGSGIGGGEINVLGVPVRDRRGVIIAVLMVYRESNNNDEDNNNNNNNNNNKKEWRFNEADIKTAKLLTGIACNTLQNLQTYIDAQAQKKESARVLGIIDEMSGDITNHSYQQLIKQLLRKIRGLVACQELEFWTISGPVGQKVLTCEISQNVHMRNQQIPVDSGHILGQVALTGLPKKIDRARVDGRYTANELRFSKGESILVIPVRLEHESHPIALIQAIDKIPQHFLDQSDPRRLLSKKPTRVAPFTENDKRLLETLAKSASVIIRNNLLFESMQGERKKNIALVSILRALQHKHDVTQMLDDATLCIAQALDCERVNIWFTDGNGALESLNVMTNHKMIADERVDEDIHELFNAIARYCAMENVYVNSVSIYQDSELWKAIYDENSGHHANHNSNNNNNVGSASHYNDIRQILFRVQQRHPSELYRVQSASTLCVPISANGRVVGVIQTSFKANDQPFTDQDQSIVEAISNEVAHAIARNISDLWIQKYIENHADVPLEVIDYFLTGSHDQYYQVMNGSNEEGDTAVSADDPIEGNESNNTIAKSGKPRVNKRFAKNNIDDNGNGNGNGNDNDNDNDSENKGEEGSSNSKLIANVKFELPKYLSHNMQLLDTCEFDCTRYQGEQLEQLVLYMLQETVQHSYHQANPFHNWQHGFFVFHFVYYLITKIPKLRSLLKKIDLCAILIAALCHDINHPGNDNLYEINIDSELSRVYNGESVLENHHAIEWLHDMSKKGSIEQLLNTNNKDIKDSDKKNLLLKLCQIIVHLGDLSAQTYIWNIAKEWELRIAQEFRNQTVKEEKAKIPVREWMAKIDIPTRYKNQHFFIEHV
ncbi:phosphodiesterase 9A, partial [Reticulomyxa filosa]